MAEKDDPAPPELRDAIAALDVGKVDRVTTKVRAAAEWARRHGYDVVAVQQYGGGALYEIRRPRGSDPSPRRVPVEPKPGPPGPRSPSRPYRRR